MAASALAAIPTASKKTIAAQKVRVSATARRTFFGVPGSVQAKYAFVPMRAARGKPDERAAELSANLTTGPSFPEAETLRADT